MAYLTREAILAADDTKFAEVDVPEWGGTVRIRTITGTERDKFEAFRDNALKRGSDIGATAYLVAMAICDENGKPIFKPEDMVALGAKNRAPLDRIYAEMCKLNGLSAAAVEDAEKN